MTFHILSFFFLYLESCHPSSLNPPANCGKRACFYFCLVFYCHLLFSQSSLSVCFSPTVSTIHFSPFLLGDNTKWPTKVDISLNQALLSGVDVSKYCWMSGKHCRPWLDAMFSDVWSGSTLFAQTRQSVYLNSLGKQGILFCSVFSVSCR